MTTCVAALCEDRKRLILVSDKMVATTSQVSEPDICKIFPLHPRWKLMLAGDDVEPAFPIIDAASLEIIGKRPSVGEVMRAVYKAYRIKRHEDAESLYLVPAGYLTLAEFLRDGPSQLGEADFDVLYSKVKEHELNLELLIAGFDHANVGHIFSVESYAQTQRGIPRRHDLGYYTIGSGSDNANYILQTRDYGPTVHVREALYFALEAKFYGEDSPTVGFRTDTIIWSVNEDGELKEKPVTEKTIDDRLAKIFRALSPQDLRESHYRTLNTLEELEGMPECPLPDEMQKSIAKRLKKKANKG